jgi:hypothetical protein
VRDAIKINLSKKTAYASNKKSTQLQDSAASVCLRPTGRPPIEESVGDPDQITVSPEEPVRGVTSLSFQPYCLFFDTCTVDQI